MLTQDDEEEFYRARKKYNIDYIQKPAKATDLRFRIMKIIDWKSDSSAPSGVYLKKCKPGIEKMLGRKNLYEYRFSQAGRIFVERNDKEKPLIVFIDPIHSYDD